MERRKQNLTRYNGVNATYCAHQTKTLNHRSWTTTTKAKDTKRYCSFYLFSIFLFVCELTSTHSHTRNRSQIYFNVDSNSLNSARYLSDPDTWKHIWYCSRYIDASIRKHMQFQLFRPLKHYMRKYMNQLAVQELASPERQKAKNLVLQPNFRCKHQMTDMLFQLFLPLKHYMTKNMNQLAIQELASPERQKAFELATKYLILQPNFRCKHQIKIENTPTILIVTNQRVLEDIRLNTKWNFTILETTKALTAAFMGYSASKYWIEHQIQHPEDRP